MVAVILALVVGIVIGWNWPQPPWARDLQDKAVDVFNSVTKKTPR